MAESRAQRRYDLGFRVGTVVVREVQVESKTMLGFVDAVRMAMAEPVMVSRRMVQKQDNKPQE